MAMLYWEDFEVGNEQRYGSHAVTEADIVEFGREFDPQPFHVDVQGAADGPFGGLIASGWQTAGWCMRMMVDNVLSRAASMGSPGLESIRWKRPVRPGDTLHVYSTVIDRRASRSRPGMGLVKSRFEVCNQNGQVVMEMVSQVMFERRPADQNQAGMAE